MSSKKPAEGRNFSQKNLGSGPPGQTGQKTGQTEQTGQKSGYEEQTGQKTGPAGQTGKKTRHAGRTGQKSGHAEQPGKKTGPPGQIGQRDLKRANPRQLSFFILNQYFAEKSNLKFLLNKTLKKYDISGLDSRFVFEVVKGTVRYVIRIDFLISLFSNKKVQSIDADVLNTLRQAAYQLLYMDKTPAYAAINESVQIAKKHIGTYSSRFVNAIMRKINAAIGNRDFLDSSIQNTFDNPAQRLSVMYSYPLWIAEHWIKSYGIEKTTLLFESFNHEATVFIRVNRLKRSKKEQINAFKESGMVPNRDFFEEPRCAIGSYSTSGNTDTYDTAGTLDAGNTDNYGTAGNIDSENAVNAGSCSTEGDAGISETKGGNIGIYGIKGSAGGGAGVYDVPDNISSCSTSVGVVSLRETDLFDDCIILKSVQNIEKIPGYARGDFSVQDFSSQFAVKYFLDPERQDRILDICGAPGGKAAYMAELTNGESEIVSVDINIKKMELFRENITRLGIKNITLVNADVTVPGFLGQDRFENYFDKIFIDAPCSALGTISKNPDAKYAGALPDLERFAKISEKILLASDRYLKPGGKIILYKCTLSKIENQGFIERFIKENPGRYRVEYPLSAYSDISVSTSVLQVSNSSSSQGQDVKKAKMLGLKTMFEPLFKKDPLFEIMPDYFSSEAGFVCILRKTA